MPAATPVERLLEHAATLLGAAPSIADGASALKEYDHFPAPLYATDRDGRIVYFNPACIDYAGRTPVIGHDHWCVSWKIEAEDGAPIAHDQCPMAVAVREGRAVRGVTAVTRRPDGKTRGFRPYPTPALDAAGQVVGGINLLVPTDGVALQTLNTTAAKCRNLARWVDDDRTRITLNAMAGDCDQQAAILRLD